MKDVKSEISGTVWKVLLAPGAAVEEEGEIMILESMKMEIPVVAPADGVLKEILVEEGESIPEGEVVAVLG